MKTIMLFFLLLACASGFSQSRYETTKISQNLKPDCSIASTSIITKVFAKEHDSDAWVKVYESEVVVDKYKMSKKAKEAEYQKAEAAAALVLSPKATESVSRETETVAEPIHER